MRKSRILLPAAALAAMVGCSSILDTEPGDRIPIENIITDAPTARAALLGAYDALQSLSYYGRNFLVVGDLAADNAEHRGTLTTLPDIAQNRIKADNGTLSGIWNAIYVAISRANLVIQRVPDVPGLADAERGQILGQAYFLRALHYHNLVKYWGAVPMPLEPVADPAEARQFVRTPVDEVYAQILEDLDSAEALMSPSTLTRRASPKAVHALRSRVLLFTGDWQGVIDAATAALALGDQLAPTYASLFTSNGANTVEDIFRMVSSAQEYNEMGYYYLTTGRREVSPSSSLYDALAANPTDARFPWSVRKTGTEIEGRKFPTTIGAEHLHIIRLAEVLLNRAEAYARLDQLALAVADYNRVRVRAGLAPHQLGVDVTTRDQVLAAIWHERRLELALEGDRFTDLVRTGRAVTVLGIQDRAYQVLFPIPQSEIDNAPTLDQNDGYGGSTD